MRDEVTLPCVDIVVRDRARNGTSVELARHLGLTEADVAKTAYESSSGWQLEEESMQEQLRISWTRKDETTFWSEL